MCVSLHVLRLRRITLVIAISVLSAPCRAGEKTATPAKPPKVPATVSPRKTTIPTSKSNTASRPAPADGRLWSPRIDAIRRIPDKLIDLDLHEVPLTDFAGELEERLGIPVQIERTALLDAGIQPDVPVSYTAAGISARSALNTISASVGLTWTVRNEVLLLTTPEDADAHHVIRTYDGDCQ